MSEPTAYFLASSAREALRPVVPEIDWENPPPDAPRNVDLTYRLHPGAERLKNNNPLPTIPWNSNYVLLTLALWLATESVQWANRKIKSTPSESAAPEEAALSPSPTPAVAASIATNGEAVVAASSAAEYDALALEVDEAVHDLLALPQLPKATQRTWHRKIGLWRERVEKAHSERRLTDKHAESISAAINKLAQALENRTGEPYDDGITQLPVN